MSIPVSRPSIKRKDMDAVLSCLVSDKLESGAQNEELVGLFLEIFNFDGGLAFREPSAAIQAAVASLGFASGARAGVSVLASDAYLRAFEAMDIQPVFIEVDLETSLLNENAALAKVEGGEVDFLVADSVVGNLLTSSFVKGVAVPVLEDATNTVGGAYDDGSAAGSLGAVSVVRTEPEDVVTTGGGMVVLTKTRKESKQLSLVSGALHRTALLSDMNASLGKIQIRSLQDFVGKRREIREVLLQAAMSSHHKTFVQSGEALPVPQGFHVRVTTGAHEAMAYALKRGVETKMTFAESCFHALSLREGAEEQERLIREFPNAAQLQLQSIQFPLYPSMAMKELELIQKVLVTLP